jgi:hypothetical protein
MSGSKQLCFRAGPELSNWLKHEAERSGLTVSAMIKSLLWNIYQSEQFEEQTAAANSVDLPSMAEPQTFMSPEFPMSGELHEMTHLQPTEAGGQADKRFFNRSLIGPDSALRVTGTGSPRYDFPHRRHRIQSPALELSEFERGKLALGVISKPADDQIARRALSTLVRHEGNLPALREVWTHHFDEMDFISVIAPEGVQAVFRYRNAGALRRLSRPPRPIAAAVSLIEVDDE